ncbi:pitrilysin family protein [Emticicia sp. 21SJ11W-3]|uniref:M16 family metallopeptidase n=1 Tax=Emticicia sp. 21SJ11W-3 TaxID=2916755 RepID=UPI00209E8772|nr:pitrilysin family protein [Emticicia sp. 21SJ11W-3]UTA68588.1 insulinase family protein [Emticicia sp. 21SJ11W-3]
MLKNYRRFPIRHLAITLLVGIFLLGGDAFAQKKGKRKKKGEVAAATEKPVIPDPVKVTSVEGITEYVLGNGMRVLMFPDPSKQTVTVNITYLVGSRHEGYGETGMAHLLEHMVFKGSTKHTNIPQELTDHGARPNGTTWLDRTNYFETFSATEENLKWALDLESDRMVNSFIKKEDLEKEFSVVRNEFEMGENDPESVLSERVIATAYLWHNYGNSTIGSREDIERVPIENLQAFYRKYYQPDNAVLLVAGKIDEAKTLKMVNEYFGVIPRPTRVLQPTYTVEPVQDGERSVTLRRVGDVQAIGVAYHICGNAHPDYPALDVLQGILTSEPAGKIYKALVESKKASGQYSYSFTNKDPTFLYFGASVLKDKDLEDAKKTMLATLDAVPTMSITKEDVDRAKNEILKSLELTLRNTERAGLQMSEYIGAGDWRLAFIYRDAVEKVKPEDVARVAKFYFKPSNRTIGLFIPEENPDRVRVPEAPNVDELVKNYKGRAVVAQGEAFDPSPANIESRTKRGQEPNGLEYALLQKSTRGNTVRANIVLRMGDEQSLQNKQTIASFTASMLNKGTKTMSRQQIKDTLDKLKAQVFIGGGGNSVSVNIESNKENLPKALAIVNDILKNPVFDANEFDKLKQENIAQIEAQKSDPQGLAFVAFQRTMNPYPKSDVRYVGTLDEQLENVKNVKLEDLKKFYSDFYGASAATVSVVGDFDEPAIKNFISNSLGTWKSPTPFKRIQAVYQDIAPTNNAIKTPDKANALFLAGLNLPLQDTDVDYPALLLGNYMLGGGFLSSRLAVRIRQKEGISYGVGSQLSGAPFDKSGNFMTYAIYAPENAEKLEKAFYEEMNKVVTEGFTEEELKAAKAGWLQSRNVSRAQDNELSSRLNSYLYYDRTLAFDADFEKKVEALTAEQINAAMKKFIDPKKITIVKAGDFDKKAANGTPAPAQGVSGSKN